MKIYIQDHQWAGCIIVVANSEEEARQLMNDRGWSNYRDDEPIQEHEIVPGFIHENFGDA